jgi:polysaccharide export outer membrane protein
MKTRIAIALVLLVCTLLASCMQQPVRKTTTRPAPAPAAQSESVEAAPAPEYPLGAGDIIKITVYNNPDLTTEAEIAQNGTISFPLVGDVKLGGLSRAAAEKAIATSLAQGGFVPNAHVNLLVLQYRSQQVSVIGEVNKPGKYPINQMVTVTDLIAMAGGIGPKGGHMVTIIKKDSAGRTAQYEVDFKTLLSGGNPEKNVRIDSEDIIYVPPAPVFYIYGEVRQPGAYPLTSDMTVRQALSLGGGLTPRGSERGIQIDRKEPNGQVSTRRVRLTDRVRPDDVVQVPEAWF